MNHALNGRHRSGLALLFSLSFPTNFFLAVAQSWNTYRISKKEIREKRLAFFSPFDFDCGLYIFFVSGCFVVLFFCLYTHVMEQERVTIISCHTIWVGMGWGCHGCRFYLFILHVTDTKERGLIPPYITNGSYFLSSGSGRRM